MLFTVVKNAERNRQKKVFNNSSGGLMTPKKIDSKSHS